MIRIQLPATLAVFVVAFSVIFPDAVFAGSDPFPRLEPDPRILAAAETSANLGTGETFSAEEFARISLVASGATDAKVDELSAKLKSLADELGAAIPAGADERAKSEAILGFMYARVISRYGLYQTRVDTALETGEYNCVSSAVLFYYFAETLGLRATGVETPDHAFCTVSIGGAEVDVETTNPYGFDPGRKKDLAPGTSGNTGTAGNAGAAYVIVPQTKYLQRKAVSERRFLALIYNNRISRLEKSGKFFEAVSLAVDARTLQEGSAGDSRAPTTLNAPTVTPAPPPLGAPTTPNTIADKELAERFLNYAVTLANAGRETDGIDFIVTARRLWGDDQRYADYIGNAAGSALNGFMKKNDWDGAFRMLKQWAPNIDSATHGSLTRVVTLNYLRYAIESESFADARARIAKIREEAQTAASAQASAPFTEKDFADITAYLYAREADRIGKAGDWLGAAAFIDGAPDSLAARQDLAKLRAAYRQNHAIGVHNKAAKAWNDGNQDLARSLVRQGLAEVPESGILANDSRAFR